MDATLPAGEMKTVTVGKTGYVIDTYKKVYENGVLIKNEYVGRSKYRMVPQKRAIGVVSIETPAPTESIAPDDMPDASIDIETDAVGLDDDNILPWMTEKKSDLIEFVEKSCVYSVL